MSIKTKVKVISIFFGLVITAFATADDSIESTANWVKWHAKKRMFLVSKQNPVGINEKIEASLVRDKQYYMLNVEIPLAHFNSEEMDRDAEVVQMLKGDIEKSLVFQSKNYTQAELIAMLQTVSHKVPGKLRIGDKWYDTEFDVEIRGSQLSGSMESKLSKFDIDPPSMLGGLMVKVEDYIKLSVQLDLEPLLKDLYK